MGGFRVYKSKRYTKTIFEASTGMVPVVFGDFGLGNRCLAAQGTQSFSWLLLKADCRQKATGKRQVDRIATLFVAGLTTFASRP